MYPSGNPALTQVSSRPDFESRAKTCFSETCTQRTAPSTRWTRCSRRLSRASVPVIRGSRMASRRFSRTNAASASPRRRTMCTDDVGDVSAPRGHAVIDRSDPPPSRKPPDHFDRRESSEVVLVPGQRARRQRYDASPPASSNQLLKIATTASQRKRVAVTLTLGRTLSEARPPGAAPACTACTPRSSPWRSHPVRS